MNNKNNYGDLIAFLLVAKERSFTRAAAQLGLSQSRLSQTIRSLEERLGVRLLTRTTRNVTPTEAGEHLIRNIAPHLEKIDSELAVLSDFGAKPAGTVRISTTENAAVTILYPAFEKLLNEYPDIHIDISIDYGPTDIVANGCDAGVRHGGLIAQGMIAQQIGPPMRIAVVATPAYFAKHGHPRVPQDLTNHNCINLRMMLSGGVFVWEFEKKGQEQKVRVNGQVVVNTATATLSAAIAGLGIAYVPEDMVQTHIATGKLERVLEDWCEPYEGYYLYYPNRRQHSAAFAAVLESLKLS